MADKKLGRPLTGERKEYDLKARVDETTHKKLLKYCKATSNTKADVIRQALEKFLMDNPPEGK